MTTMTETDDSRLGRLKELSKAIHDLWTGQRQILPAIMGIGAAQTGLLTTLVIRIAG